MCYYLLNARNIQHNYYSSKTACSNILCIFYVLYMYIFSLCSIWMLSKIAKGAIHSKHVKEDMT